MVKRESQSLNRANRRVEFFDRNKEEFANQYKQELDEEDAKERSRLDNASATHVEIMARVTEDFKIQQQTLSKTIKHEGHNFVEKIFMQRVKLLGFIENNQAIYGIVLYDIFSVVFVITFIKAVGALLTYKSYDNVTVYKNLRYV